MKRRQALIFGQSHLAWLFNPFLKYCGNRPGRFRDLNLPSQLSTF
jgi:hypothetical protein